MRIDRRYHAVRFIYGRLRGLMAVCMTACVLSGGLWAAQGPAWAAVMVPPIPIGDGQSAAGSGAAPGAGDTSGTAAMPGDTPEAGGASGTGAAPGTSDATGGPGNGASPGTGGAVDSGSAAGPGGASGQTAPGANPFSHITTVNTTASEPAIQAEGAYLLDAQTGRALYAKNGDTRYYPASITKLMTALLVLESSGLDDVVNFSKSATTNLEAGSVTLNLTEGDRLTVRQCLYGLMLKSANEVANGLAEHVAGSVSAFADRMNMKAASLGCASTHFANPNGLNDSNHYTTPHDMALIARAAFENQQLLAINQTLSYQIPATKKAGARTVTLGHKMFYPTDSRYYEGIIGGKTGYTSLAGNTLVTGVEKNGVRLIAVVMKSRSTQYADTKALLDYGFANRDAILSGAQSQARWEQEGDRWRFVKPDGQRAAGELMSINGRTYWFDSDGMMAVGWRKLNGSNWYYFKKSGAMAVGCWVQDNGYWFYMGADGAMLRNAATPDGYQVGADGVWVQ